LGNQVKKKKSKEVDVEEEYAKCIGRIAMYFPLIHNILERFAWNLWGIPFQFAKILTKDLPSKQLVTKIRASLAEMELEEDVSKELKALLKRVEELTHRRNRIFHSMWTLEGDRPVLVERHADTHSDSPDLEDLNKLLHSVTDLVDDLWKFSRRNKLMGAIGLATKKANLVPKHPDTP
jgi:hypothetical protein